jgi:uncharacterized membrane protein YheB (UPF0754 family)
MAWWLLLIPIATALSSWIAIKLLITFLFHPQQPRSIFGFRIQGILPSKKHFIASEVGRFAAKHFISPGVIGAKINDPSNLQKIMPVIEEHIDDFLRNKLKKEMPVVGMFVGDKTISSLKKVFITELESLFPKIIGGFVSNIVNDLNIEQLVTQKIKDISLSEVEIAFQNDLSKELGLIQLISGLIGLLIGLITMIIIYIIK